MPVSRSILMGLAGAVALAAPAPVPALDPAGLAWILKSGQWTVIEFGGPTCVPCMKMQPVLAQLQEQFGGRVQFRNFYVTQYLQESRSHGIMVMPTQVLFAPDGREVKRHMGFWAKEEFLAALAQAGVK
jgi:thioredoxin 1